MNKVIIVTDHAKNIIRVYSYDANVPELYKQKKDRYKITEHEVSNGIQFIPDETKLNFGIDNVKHFER